jgi:predicted MPP superfamily phosphohydrolase
MHSLLTGPLTTERVTVKIHDLPLRLHGTTLVQLSDFHFDGCSLSQELLTTAIAQTNAIRADLVVLTGDFITKRSHHFIDELAAYLGQLQSRAGVYAIMGNHDSTHPNVRQTVQSALANHHIQPLWNDLVYPLGADLPLVGLADLYSRDCRPAQFLAQLDPATPRIVLAHNPDTFAQLHDSRADLVLSGHTHGGQVYLPGLGPAPSYLNRLGDWLPWGVRQFIPYLNKGCDRIFRHWEWASGLHQVGRNQLYVNRGLGSYLPGRLWCPPELTVITLVVA